MNSKEALAILVKHREEGFRLLAALLLTAALSGCAAVLEFLNPKKQEPNQYPAAYRTEMLDYLKKNSTEIGTVREAYISAPSMKPFGSESRYFVCVKASGNGQQMEKIAFLSAGKIIQFIDAGGQCASAFYQPFPELTAMLAQATGKK
jgi:uncharacterized protein YceK